LTGKKKKISDGEDKGKIIPTERKPRGKEKEQKKSPGRKTRRQGKKEKKKFPALAAARCPSGTLDFFFYLRDA
jgi:hypothetical protein